MLLEGSRVTPTQNAPHATPLRNLLWRARVSRTQGHLEGHLSHHRVTADSGK